MTALNVEQRGDPILHDDDIGRPMRAYRVEDAEQLDDMIPKPVIIETPETFQLVLLLPRRSCCVRHLLDYHDSLLPVGIGKACAPHLAEIALLDLFAAHLLALALVFLPQLLRHTAPQSHSHQRLRHGNRALTPKTVVVIPAHYQEADSNNFLYTVVNFLEVA